jgi:mannan endo-1,4-beta-mannosidase
MKRNLHNVFTKSCTLIFLNLLLSAKLFSAPVIYEAEKGVLVGAVISTSNSGYTGTGYVSSINNTGDKVTVTVNAATAGIYTLTIRYNGPFGDKTQDLYVNNIMSSSIAFPGTTTYTTLNAGGIFLNAGSNTISIQKNWGYTDIDNFGIELAPKHIYNVVANPINPNADTKTIALYNLLKSKYGNCILSGQTSYWPETIALSGKTPALRGFDLQNYSPHNPWYNWTATDDGTVQSAIDWYNSTGGNGIVTFHWHWFSPSGGALSTSTFYTNQTTFDVSQGVIPGTQENKDILRDIDAIAVQLKRLQAAGIPVLWRPLHEAGGAWFWWGAKGSAACKSLYDIMYNRLTSYHGINNLIWVWSTPEASWYPGNAKVDILGYDSYPGAYNYAPQKSIFDQLFTIVGGQKILAMSENGPIPDITQCFQYDAPWCYFMSWVDLVAKQNTSTHIVDAYNQTCNLADISTPPPSIASFSPSCGSAGNSVTITGTNLTAATSVLFNGVAGTKTSNTSTQIIVTAPSGVSTGTISVTNAYGTGISSGTFTVAADPTIAIALSSGTNPSCAGSSLAFTATRTNGGSTPAYQWKVNGTNAGTNSATFTASTLANSDAVSCVLTSNGSCVTTTSATSNTITLVRNANKTPIVTIAITSGSNPSCAGSAQTFTATATDGGTAPAFQWKVNGVNAGTNSSTFTSSTFANASVVTCQLTSNLTCVTSTTDVSNSITLTKTANVTPVVTIALTNGTNPSCAGSSLTFTATPTNGGTTPAYQWQVNGINAGTNSATFTSSSLANANSVTSTMTTSVSCYTTATDISNTISLTVNTMPIANAGPDQNVTTSSTNLSGNTPATGSTGSWSTTGSASIVSPSDPHSLVNNLASGANTFRWTVINGTCTAYNDVIINRSILTGINSMNDSVGNYTVYPNPFIKDINLKIETRRTEKMKLLIFDMKGAILYTSDEYYTNQNISIDQDMPEGVLLVQIVFGSRIRQFKVVKISQ